MTLAQKIILTITILIYSLFDLIVIAAYFAQSNVCQTYSKDLLTCLAYQQPPPVALLFTIWLIGTGVLFLIAAPLYLIWGKHESQHQSTQ